MLTAVKPLPKAEQSALCLLAQRGDVAARNRLVVTSMGLVYSVAHRYKHAAGGAGLELDELASEGAIGLTHAITKFDPTLGTAFTTYAVLWIRNHISTSIAQARGIRNSDDRRRKYVREVLALVDDGVLTREEAIDRVAKKYKMKTDTVLGLVETYETVTFSLDATLSGEAANSSEAGATFLDLVRSREVPADEQLAAAELRTRLQHAIHRVLFRSSPRERIILERRILCEHEDQATLEEIGSDLKISRERVRQLEGPLRNNLRLELLRRTEPKTRQEVLEQNRQAHRRLRGARRRAGLCPACGNSLDSSRSQGLPATISIRKREASTLSHCDGCHESMISRGVAHRRRRGQKEKRPVTLTYEGRTLSLAAWSRETGIPLKILWNRAFGRRWSIDRVFEPVLTACRRRAEANPER